MEQDDPGPIRAEARFEHVHSKAVDVVDETRADAGREDRRAVRLGGRRLRVDAHLHAGDRRHQNSGDALNQLPAGHVHTRIRPARPLLVTLYLCTPAVVSRTTWNSPEGIRPKVHSHPRQRTSVMMPCAGMAPTVS